jgi:hypothetical protein
MTAPGGMNHLIREAAGWAPGEQLEPAAEQPVGDIGVGRGGAGVAPPSDPRAELNRRIRFAAQATRGEVTLEDALRTSDNFNA